MFWYLFSSGADGKHADKVNPGNDAKAANQMDAYKKEQLKKDLGKRMSGKVKMFKVAYKKYQKIFMFHHSRSVSKGLFFSS